MIKDYKEMETWKEALAVIKKNAPKGLYELWKDIEPIAVSPFVDGIYVELENSDNSYNWMDRDANNIVYQSVLEHKDFHENKFIWICFHKSGDVRGNYTDYFMFKLEDVEDMLFGLSDEYWKELGGDVEQ